MVPLPSLHRIFQRAVCSSCGTSDASCWRRRAWTHTQACVCFWKRNGPWGKVRTRGGGVCSSTLPACSWPACHSCQWLEGSSSSSPVLCYRWSALSPSHPPSDWPGRLLWFHGPKKELTQLTGCVLRDCDCLCSTGSLKQNLGLDLFFLDLNFPPLSLVDPFCEWPSPTWVNPKYQQE